MTLEGGTALALFEDKLTTVPLPAAAPFKVTVPVDEVPPATDVGARVRPVMVAGVIVRVAVADEPPVVAVMVAVVDVETPEVVMAKVAEVAPAATVTLVGGRALVLLEVRATDNPPAGATPLRVSVPVDDVPPSTDVGETTKLDGIGAVTVRVVVRVTDPAVA